MNVQLVWQLVPIREDWPGRWTYTDDEPISERLRLDPLLGVIRDIGFEEATIVDPNFIAIHGATGAIKVKNGPETYLYRELPG